MGLARMPLVPLALALAAGIGTAPWLPLSAWLAVGLAALLAAGLLAALGDIAPATALLLVAVATAGAAHVTSRGLGPDHVARLDLPRQAEVVGRLAREPARRAPDRTRLLVEVTQVDGAARTGLLQLTAYGPPPALAAGQRVAARLRLHRASGFRNPGGFDHGQRLRREGIHVVGSVDAGRLEALEAPRPAWQVRARRAARAAMEAGLPPASAALLAGLLLGERADLPPAIDEAFRRAGLYHLLAVSGFNVALVAGATWGLLALAGIGRRTTATASIVVVVAFGLVVGPEPSVLRAVVMGVLVLAATLLEREAAVANSLALAAIVVLALEPADLLEPGFQLSFAATAGIVAAPLPRHPLLAGLGVTLAAQLAVLPIQLAHFNQLSTLAPVANLAAVPLAGLATILGLVAVAAGAASDAAGTAMLGAVWPVLLGLRGVAAVAGAVPGALVHLPAPPWAASAAYAGALLLALVWWHARAPRPRVARWAGPAALALLAVAVGLAGWPLVRPPDGLLRLTVLDVGQGDAMVLETPDGQAVVVDAGSGGPMRLDAGALVVSPFLWNRGYRRLAATVATHADADHAGGMATVRRHFEVRESWDELAEPRWLGGVAFTPLRARTVGTGRNDGSLALRVEHGLATFVLASDLGARAERALVASGVPLGATVLKVAHHGARTSTTPELVAAVRPVIAVVSVGSRNPFGHPDPGVLERLAAAGARVHRTDRDGAVILETDGRVLRVTRWASRGVERYCLDPEAVCCSDRGAISPCEETHAWRESTSTTSSSGAATSSARSPAG